MNARGEGFTPVLEQAHLLDWETDEEMAAAGTNIVNLDALIRRADLATPEGGGEDIRSIYIGGLERYGALYPALRKPDFQRETASWTPDQVADLVCTFGRRDLIPAVILWRSGETVFVIDGAHRLSALIAWVQNDYGDGDVSKEFFQGVIPEAQQKAATKARDLVEAAIGSYADHRSDNPDVRADIRARAARMGWQNIDAQWVGSQDYGQAEKSFFRINQGGTKIDATEKRVLEARRSPSALAARAILRGGTGTNYWSKFKPAMQRKIEALGKELHDLLFEPTLKLPVKTLDIPIGGHGYGPKVLPFAFDLVNLANEVEVSDSSKTRGTKPDKLPEDPDGSETLKYLTEARRLVWRICSMHASSLGIHPALYFYSRGAVFQPVVFLGFLVLIKEWDTAEFKRFTRVRSGFERFLLGNRSISDAVHTLGTGSRSRPAIIALYRAIIDGLSAGKSDEAIKEALAADKRLRLFVTEPLEDLLEGAGGSFGREVRGGAYLQAALPTAPKCPTCGGLMHVNAMQAGHRLAKRDGGSKLLKNAQMQHPFCNSTVDN